MSHAPSPNADRWGGPGASHENRDKPRPDPTVKDPGDPDRDSRHSQVSGGGGEGDLHHRRKAGRAQTSKPSRKPS